MAAKEEALVLKYLKKNPGSEALDVSFGTDVDESDVKETLQQLLAKQMVAVSVSDSGVSTWTIATPPAKVAAPKPEKAERVVSESFGSSSASDDESSSTGGTGKGFVIVVALLTALVSIGVSYVVGSGKIAAEKAAFDISLKNTTDSVGYFRIATNTQIDALKQEIKKLQPPAADEKADAKPSKVAPKKGKKGKK